MILWIFVAKDEWKIILSSFAGKGAYKRYTLAFFAHEQKSLFCVLFHKQAATAAIQHKREMFM